MTQCLSDVRTKGKVCEAAGVPSHLTHAGRIDRDAGAVNWDAESCASPLRPGRDGFLSASQVDGLLLGPQQVSSAMTALAERLSASSAKSTTSTPHGVALPYTLDPGAIDQRSR
jgi:hypothetical protein